jgi:hypothetical protein
MLNDIIAAALPILGRHIPGKRRRFERTKDRWGYFGQGNATVILFRWTDHLGGG